LVQHGRLKDEAGLGFDHWAQNASSSVGSLVL